MVAPILTMTSGSSGCSKMLLNTKETNSDYFLQGVSVCVDVMRKSFPETTSLQAKVRLFYPMAERYSEAGVRIVATPFSSEHTHHGCTSPPAILEVEREKIYTTFTALFVYVCMFVCSGCSVVRSSTDLFCRCRMSAMLCTFTCSSL